MGELCYMLVLKLGFGCDKYVRNAIRDMYAKYGPVEVARQVFNEMGERTVVDWNVMVSGYWNWGREDEASRRGILKSIVSCNEMLSGYAQNGVAEEAMGQFDETMNSGIQPNATTCVAVISSCSSLGEPCLAQSLVKMLDEKCVHLNYFIKATLLDKHAKCGSLETAREIFDELGVHKNSAAWNAMISDYTCVGDLIAGYAQNGQSAMALELFQEMAVTKNLKPDEVTMVSVLLSACGHLGALELGKWAVNFITENQIKLCVSGFNYLIFMYPKCWSMSDARKVFQKMATRDVVSYNTLIRGFAAHGHGSEALELMSKMKDEGSDEMQ
ncbi:pentatricopeptide repeat (PPR) superfamily protein [Actinidia rufa]|uniref:Pentatricopeptide repeat (PPR) superfamily protein n=1 Tax=Actinidia rufa TaxID=165716 RepID=A0A7J0F903_9ERIC|nr:pentatricopeptide repeat (PPR) superfamily protein [Actinidia rufa]